MDNKLNLNIDEEESLSQDRSPRDQGFLWKDFEKDKFEARRKTLAERFVVPPFSILDTRQGYWQQGKRLWLELGIKSELGRGESMINNDNIKNYESTALRREADKRSNLQGAPKKPEWATGTGTALMAPGTSMFDPVLCEVLYKWFCPARGYVLDPFAGGSVRGIIAEYLEYKYTGIELREEQVKANNKQAELLKLSPQWIIGDSEIELDNLRLRRFDFIFSCPPYFNLEVYSDLPGELSAMKEYDDFLNKYRSIIKKSCELLTNDRFVCFVIANIRDKKQGRLYPLVSDTIKIFEEIGLYLYNEAILINQYGSLPIRVARQFKASRKLGKMHQNILIFKKG